MILNFAFCSDLFLCYNCAYFYLLNSSNARLATSVLSFLCLHNIYIAKVVTNSDITAVTNRKTSIIEVLEKTFLLVGKSVTMDISCLLLKSMISFLWLYWWIKSFRFLELLMDLTLSFRSAISASLVMLSLLTTSALWGEKIRTWKEQ